MTSQLATIQPWAAVTLNVPIFPERMVVARTADRSSPGRPNVSSSPRTAAVRFSLGLTPSELAWLTGSYQHVTACGVAVK